MHAELHAPCAAAGTDAAPELAGPAARHHFLSIHTLFRRPLFLDPDGARAIARLQDDATVWGASRCLAWVLMPDHWQGLVQVAADDSIERLVRRFKWVSARAVPPHFRVNGWLWTRGFSERLLDAGEDPVVVARHLVANPVRAGLAASVGDWPYWNAAWLQLPSAGASGP